MPSRRSYFRFMLLFLLIGLLIGSNISSQTLTAELVADGFDRPVFLTSPPGDLERLFVLELKTGLIKIIKNGIILTESFLDINNLIVANAPEQGLLGMAFHPNYGENGHFFVNYTGSGGATNIVRYSVSPANDDLADPQTSKTILTFPTALRQSQWRYACLWAIGLSIHRNG